MNNRIEAMKANNKGKEQFCKTSLNGSYGYDGMNTEKFVRTKVKNESQTYLAQIFDSFVSTRSLSDNQYLVTYNPKTFRCDTCLQESYFTLDNAKFWYLNFVYNFMYKCLDMNRMHFIEGDTDSAYWAVAGDSNENYQQGFKYVIRESSLTNPTEGGQEFYDQHVYEWFPNPDKGIEDMKKLLGLAIENQDENCVALAPKCYCLFPKVAEELLKKDGIETDDPKLLCVTKMKGVKKSLNQMAAQDYQSAIVKPIIGKNINLQMKSNQMSKIKIQKNALTATHTKAIVLSNQSCAPFIYGYDANLDFDVA
jgi:hypothetical protein